MGHSKTTIQQRPLSKEEKQLYADQVAYMEQVKPIITNLLSVGSKNMGKVYEPDWKGLYSNYQDEYNKLMGEQQNLIGGQLPSAYTNAKKAYYNQLYEDSMGKGLASLAKSGVVNSSRFNTVTNDYQKNLDAQMSKDYTNDMNTQKSLLQQRYDWLQQPIQTAALTNEAGRKDATDWFNTAATLQGTNTNALSSISQNESNRTYLTQKNSGIGSILSGVASVGSMFLGK